MAIKADDLCFRDLTEDDRQTWGELQASDPDLASPYFSFGYVAAADVARPGVRVLRFSEAGAPIAYWPFRPGPLGTARPVGGPMDDLHGIVAAPDTVLDLTGADVTRAVGGYSFSAVPSSQRRHGIIGQVGSGNQVMDLSSGYQAWLDERAGDSSNFRREQRKVEKLLDAPDTIVTHDIDDPAIMKRLFEQKSEAYRQSGHFDLFAIDWPAKLLTELLERRDETARGILSTLSIGGKVAAISYCMRSRDVMHYWFPAYEEAFAKQKPGLALLFSLAMWGADNGIRELHLGLGETRYKRQMATWMAPVRCGTLALSPAQKLATRCTELSFKVEGTHKLLDVPAKYARKYERAVLTGTWRA
ncbi:GNAT family N-acetyltransferase [Henriciella litoralis]|uniref:GNAT family N-acetyltransferase n=1 Tax=Henriciella litoralis TaxID=568102 RepID=UPI000A058C53|nr:GNAT family N-acetyltransferase [Henriciella litoralis]